MMIEFRLLDQTLHLYSQRALYWVEARTVVVADVHLGKAATFRAHGISLPGGTTQTNLTNLTAVLDQTKAQRLLILGDLLHAIAGRDVAMIEQVDHWRRQFSTLTIDLVLGNHDHHAGPPPESWRMHCVDRIEEGPFVWQHEPEDVETGYVIAGHVHPAVRLRGPGERLTLPCFYFGANYAILPAFGDFTGTSVLQPKVGDTIFVLAEKEVIRFDG